MAEWGTTGSNGSGATEVQRNEGAMDLEETLERARVELTHYKDLAADFIRERPVVAVAGAITIGFLLGRLVSRR